jgi:hypothetical protein
MTNSKIRTAKERLALHKLQGVSSKLSIYDAADLMDRIKNNPGVVAELKKPIFFSASSNTIWN